ncbi:neuropeptide F receptor-like [Varroa jacobsoni]|uniref:neuropeptide F receptor-like n=1 Tax=Varroa jacobsoni TaxID=62625 RepID=UPI000BF53FB1|nr:neuropeptide F receptor-like [Varroa jacobsoni]
MANMTTMKLVDVVTSVTPATAAFNTTENLTTEEIMQRLEQMMDIRAIDENWLIGLLLVYSLLIMTGALGNGLVCLAVARKPAMRTARNIYIINLAISDLILCLFTMPFSLVEIVLKFWPLGLVTCKLVAGLEATSIFVSTISIMAIAIDRYKVILYPTRETFNPLSGFFMVATIWMIALLLATPLFIYKTVFTHEVPQKFLLLQVGLQAKVDYCVEHWPHNKGRFFYSLFTMVLQYMLPIGIVSAAYASICRKLRDRMMARGGCQAQLEEKLLRERQRVQRTNKLLVAITVVFILSWLPLNILNTWFDYFETQDSKLDVQFRVMFAFCHMCGMSSACTNPFLYGWLNDNFRKEFQEILSGCFPQFVARFTSRQDTINESRLPSMHPAVRTIAGNEMIQLRGYESPPS